MQHTEESSLVLSDDANTAWRRAYADLHIHIGQAREER